MGFGRNGTGARNAVRRVMWRGRKEGRMKYEYVKKMLIEEYNRLLKADDGDYPNKDLNEKMTEIKNVLGILKIEEGNQ
jgi:hypothetical protein